MTGATLIDACCEQALCDPRAYQNGRNAVAAVEEVNRSLKKRLVRNPALSEAWGCMPETLTALLHLHALDAPAYEAFMVGTAFPGHTLELSLSTLSGLWHLDGVLGALSDDHDYALGGEGAQQQLTHQAQLPQWRPCVRMLDVLTALQQVPALVANPPPVPLPAARRVPGI